MSDVTILVVAGLASLAVSAIGVVLAMTVTSGAINMAVGVGATGLLLLAMAGIVARACPTRD